MEDHGEEKEWLNGTKEMYGKYKIANGEMDRSNEVYAKCGLVCGKVDGVMWCMRNVNVVCGQREVSNGLVKIIMW